MSFEKDYSAACNDLCLVHSRLEKLYGAELNERLKAEQQLRAAALGRRLRTDERHAMLDEVAKALSDECAAMRSEAFFRRSRRGSANAKA